MKNVLKFENILSIIYIIRVCVMNYKSISKLTVVTVSVCLYKPWVYTQKENLICVLNCVLSIRIKELKQKVLVMYNSQYAANY